MPGGRAMLESDRVQVRGDHDPVTRAVVRVWGARRTVVGGGFVVGPGLVATAADVAAAAVGADPDGPGPSGAAVEVDLPLLDGGGSARLRATVERWEPVGGAHGAGIALLRLATGAPDAARMPPVRRVEGLRGHRFRALGFPEGAWDGVWATGLIGERSAGGWSALLGDPGGQAIAGGFGGAPVWDMDSSAVVGMVVVADRGGGPGPHLVPIDRVLGVDPESLPCPYRGLAPFGEEHSELFFGRDDDVERVADALARWPVVAVAGPSGVGKSSLVRAGLVPRLRAQGARVEDVRVLPGVPLQLPAPAAGQVLVLDQFEELAADRPELARRLLGRIAEASGAGVRAVLTVRWAALDQLLTADLAGTIRDGTVLLAPLGRGGLRAAVTGPARRAPGLGFEVGLVERIVDDAGVDPGGLPLVAALLADLWERREGGYLTLAGYRAAGGVAGAVAQQAERVTAAVRADPAGHDRLRRLCTALAAPDRAGRFVRRPVRLADLPDDLGGVVPVLAAGRLVVVDDPTARGTVQLAHQALIEHWPRLRGWLAEDRDFLAWRAQLDQARDRWVDADRDDGALLRGTALAAATGWTSTRALDLDDDQRDYVRRSVARNRREVRRWRVVTAVLAVLVLAAGALAVVAARRGADLATQLAAANAEVLGRESVTRAAADPALAAQLALAAWRSDPTSPRARTGLAGAALALQSVDAEFPEVLEPSGFFLARGDSVLEGFLDRWAVLTGISGSTAARRDLPETGGQLALGPDGRRLAEADGGDRGLLVHDLTSAAAPRVLAAARPGERTVQLRFSPDGARLGQLVDRPAGRVLRVLDVATGTVVAPELGLLPGDDSAFWLTSDPDRLLVRPGPTAPWEIRSLVTGEVLGAVPAGARVALDGDATVSCQDAGPADPEAPAAVTVAPLVPGVAARRITSQESRCAGMMLTLDTGAVVEAGLGDDVEAVRLTDLRDGRAQQFVLPPFERASLFDRAPDPAAPPGFPGIAAAVVGGPGGRTDLLVPSARTLLRLRGEPAPPAAGRQQPQRDLDASGRYLVGTDDGEFVVEDRATAARLAALPRGTDRRTKRAVYEDLWVVSPTDPGWRVDRYGLPALQPVASYALPTDAAGRPGVDVREVAAGGPALLLAGNRLSAFDPGSGRPVGAATVIDGPRGGGLSGDPLLWSRPGHPGQGVVVAGRSLEVWDVVAGKRLGAIDIGALVVADAALDVAFDGAGNRVAVHAAGAAAVAVFDVGSGAPVGDPVPVDGVDRLLGFDADGYLVMTSNTDHVAFVDVDGGRESGSVDGLVGLGLPAAGAPVARTPGLSGALPVEFPLTARGWADRVCAGSGARPFTPTELAILPAGMSTEPPCS
jgi:hypothetical protein